MKENMNFYQIPREEWQGFSTYEHPPLTEAELHKITSLNDRISMQDVTDIYIPLCHLLHLYMKEATALNQSKNQFLKRTNQQSPYIIGIAGSVAVGKSTTARLVQMLLARFFPNKNVQLMTTDGFLYPNKILEERNIMNRKGFPESYNMQKLLHFLDEVKSGKSVCKIPIYSHDVYDIVADEYEEIRQPDILIVEGINTLQLPANQKIYISDFFDFSIFVDAAPQLIEQWYLERFEALLDTAFLEPKNYYYELALGKREDALQTARNIWQTVNLKNLTDFILPTRERADLILHKTTNHKIDQVYLRKY